MVDNKNKSLNKINKDFEALSNLVLTQLNLLGKELEDFNGDISAETIKSMRGNEKQIDKFELKLDALIVEAMTLYNPYSSELRRLFAVYKMVNDLERIGDLVLNIIYYIDEIDDKTLLVNSIDSIVYMHELTTKMVSKSLFSYTNGNLEEALWAIKKDDKIDKLYHEFIEMIIKDNSKDKELEKLMINLSKLRSLAAAIERIGDQATNIAETAIFASSGKDIRHGNINKFSKNHE